MTYRGSRKILLVLLSLTGLGAFGLWGWKTGYFAQWADELFLKRWLREKIEATLVPLRPKLPFEIVSWDYDARAQDLRRGRISEVTLVVRKSKETVSFKGPLDFDWISSGKNWVATYRPTLTTEGPWKFTGPAVELSIAASQKLDRLIRVGWVSDEFALENPELGLKLAHSRLETGFVDDSVYLNLNLASGNWTSPTQPTHASEFSKFKLEAEVPLKLSPSLQLGNPIAVQLGLGSIALAWDAYFVEQKTPLSALVSFDGNLQDSKSESKVTFELPAKKPELVLFAQLASGFQPRQVDWKLAPTSIPALLKNLSAIPEVSAVSANWTFPHGTLSTHGTAEFGPAQALPEKFSGQFKIENAEVRDSTQSLAAKGVDLVLDRSASGNSDIQLRVQKGFWKHFPWTIPDWKFKITRDPYSEKSTIVSTTPLEFPISGLPIRFQPIQGSLTPQNKEEKFEIHTGLKASQIPFEVLGQGLCKKAKLFPPGVLSIQFPKLTFAPTELSTEGLAEADFFGGKIQLTDLSVLDYLTSTPESDFSVKWTGIRLSDLGNWVGFGEMDGTLEGHAEDVSLLRTYPIQFDVRMEAKPLHHSDIVFSPDAMKNMVQLFASEEIDNLPGIAKWLAFGWPSRVFGGYDIDYAGISIYSHEGSILIETLDPEKVVQRDRKHYILYGKRFRMPLQTYSYPLVVDATAMGNFVRHMGDQLHALAEAKNKDPAKPTPAPIVTPEDNHEPPCLVPENF